MFFLSRLPRQAILITLFSAALLLGGCEGSSSSVDNPDFLRGPIQRTNGAGFSGNGDFTGGDGGGPRGPVGPGSGGPVTFQPGVQGALQSITASPIPVIVAVGGTQQLTVLGTVVGGGTVTVVDTADVDLSFVSDNGALATVSATGLVTGQALGATSIEVSVTSEGVTLTTSVPVTISNTGPTPFALYVTQSPGGPTNNDPNNWGGVLGFLVQGTNGAFIADTGIPEPQLDDPVDIVFKEGSNEVFVANRHGNNRTGGVDGSVARFFYDSVNRTFTPNGSFTTPGPAHQMAFNPINGELFVALVGPEVGVAPPPFAGGVARFTFLPDGTAVPNGVLNTGGGVRGVAVSPDGDRLYITTASNLIRQFDLTDDTELAPVAVTGGVNLHYIKIVDDNTDLDQLYVADIDADAVFRFDIEGNNSLTQLTTTPADGAASVAFSPDGLEMYAPGHITSFVIHRFAYNSLTDTWTPTGPFSTGFSMVGILVLE